MLQCLPGGTGKCNYMFFQQYFPLFLTQAVRVTYWNYFQWNMEKLLLVTKCCNRWTNNQILNIRNNPKKSFLLIFGNQDYVTKQLKQLIIFSNPSRYCKANSREWYFDLFVERFFYQSERIHVFTFSWTFKVGLSPFNEI